jgi:ribosome-associated translation inhibitor RaiA
MIDQWQVACARGGPVTHGENDMADERTILIEGIHSPEFEEHVRGRIMQTLERVSSRRTAAKVIFADVNGPKGGMGTRCTVVVEMPRRREVSVEEMGDTVEVAFDAAFDALKQRVTRDHERRRELARRPKKYFLAKRLLSPDTTLESPELRPESPRITPGPRPRRTRRRPSK